MDEYKPWLVEFSTVGFVVVFLFHHHLHMDENNAQLVELSSVSHVLVFCFIMTGTCMITIGSL